MNQRFVPGARAEAFEILGKILDNIEVLAIQIEEEGGFRKNACILRDALAKCETEIIDALVLAYRMANEVVNDMTDYQKAPNATQNAVRQICLDRLREQIAKIEERAEIAKSQIRL